MTSEPTQTQIEARIRHIVATNLELNRALQSSRATVAAQRRQLTDRPSRGAYETLAKERDRFEALWDASRERIAVLNRRIADLEKTVERVGG